MWIETMQIRGNNNDNNVKQERESLAEERKGRHCFAIKHITIFISVKNSRIF